MKLDWIRASSTWGTELRHKFITHGTTCSKLAVLFPGMNYSCELPLLHYAGSAALELGFDVLGLEYGYQAARTEMDIKDLPTIVHECSEAISSILGEYEQVVFISKSLGTIVAGEVHRKLQMETRHIYLTPLQQTVSFINSTDGIVIYGGKDALFGEEAVKQVAPEGNLRIIVIPDADHGLQVGSVRANLDILRDIVDVYLEFLKG